MAGSLANVIARVTGGSPSKVDGTLAVTPDGRANFYFINPAGVMFGRNAALDVNGDIHVSTADELRFKDGARYSATAPGTSSLSAAAPAAFGFLGNSAANNSLLRADGAQLAVKAGRTLDWVGGKITVENGATLQAEAGEIRMVARAGADGGDRAGQVSVQPGGDGRLPLPADAPNARNARDITVTGAGTTLDASGEKAGRVGVWGGAVAVGDAAAISAATRGAAATSPSSGIDIHGRSFVLDGAGLNAYADLDSQAESNNVAVVAASDVALVNAAQIYAASVNATSGRSGLVAISAGNNLSLLGNSLIYVAAEGSAAAGHVSLHAGNNIALLAGSTVTSNSYGSGLAGTVALWAGKNLAMAGASVIDSRALASGDAGTVKLGAGGNVTLRQTALATTATWGLGHAGTITVNAGGRIDITGVVGQNLDSDSQTGLYSNARASSQGDAGSVLIRSGGGVSVVDSGTIATDTEGSGKAGEISVDAGGPVALRNGGTITSGTYARGDGGRVTLVTAGRLDIENAGSAIKAIADKGSTGAGGTIAVNAREGVALRDGGQISSRTASTANAGSVAVATEGGLVLEGAGTAIGSGADLGSRGNVGRVDIAAKGDVAIKSGAVVTGSASAEGQAGAIKLATRGKLTIDGAGAARFTGIASEANANSVGDAGDIQVDVGKRLTIRDGGAISSDTYAHGQAGNVVATADAIELDQAAISARAGRASSGNAGNIELSARDALVLAHSSAISIENQGRAAFPREARTGSLDIKAPDIALTGGSRITTQSTANVAAGAIRISFARALRLEGGRISTSAHDGDGGGIAIRGGQRISLADCHITTNVTGTANGNGGGISISADTLLLRSASITADTLAPARGGNIALGLKGIVAEGDNLIIGGNPFLAGLSNAPGWNIIRAAAPNGLAGLIAFATPQLNLSGVLANLGGTEFTGTRLDENHCARDSGNSLSRSGNGGTLATDEGAVDY
jgi:filamentous hemagglutinin family protein